MYTLVWKNGNAEYWSLNENQSINKSKSAMLQKRAAKNQTNRLLNPHNFNTNY